MPKLTIQDLNGIRERERDAMALRKGEGRSAEEQHMDLLLCAGTGCVASGSLEIKKKLDEELTRHGLDNRIRVVATGCNGFCAQGPVMVVQPGQVTPMHYHWHKMEDIANRGGGDLVFRLHNADADDGLSGSPVRIVQDGIQRTVSAGEEVILKPGESLTLPTRLYHEFYGRGEAVMVGEVSMVNDDANDNRFLEPAGRFPEIEEDEDPKYLLCNDYGKFL